MMDFEAAVEKLRKLDGKAHFIRNICEHRNERGCSPTLYCYGIHMIRESGREVFNGDFILKDYNVSFFSNLKKAKELCCHDCGDSFYYFVLAEKYLKRIIKYLT